MTNGDKMRILQDITVIVDTREQKNQHILDYLKENKIPYIVEKLDVADYSFVLPNYPELNMDKIILVEKKNSLSEIATNFTSARDRFTRQFERMTEGQKIHLVIETATWKKLFNGTYRSKTSPNSMKASLLTWCIRYKCPYHFVEKAESPELIYKIMYYELNEFLNTIK